VESVLANTEYPTYEIIVVDNGSTDSTPAYLRSLMRRHSHVRAVLNADNLGFARANNQGLALATGDILVLLNNDTLVPHGWLTRLVRHLEDLNVGLIGPVTNRIGNEAQVDVPYRTYGGFVRFARDHSRAHDEGQLFEVRTLMMFCLAMRRAVYEQIGSLDERFKGGTFEDDDYAMRARSAGYRVVGAEDVFVHHFGEASFGKLIPTGEYAKLFEANRRRFEEKWDTHWEPHRHRPSQRYRHLIRRIREVVRDALPRNATVVVVSKGDDELLNLYGRRGWHFPQTEDGTYAGYYPAASTAAIAQLEALRSKGAEFLLFPDTSLWWLEHYPEFGRHLQSRYREVARREGTCLIYDLRESGTDRAGTIVWGSEDVRAPIHREVPA
jgi:GT2 family glycosyltransferase